MTKFEPIDAQTLLSTPLPPVRWLVPDLLPAGLSMLVGGSKSGKSWLCLWLSLQIAMGGEVWNRPVSAQTVLYLCLEDTYARIQSRLFHLTQDDVPDRLYFQTVCEAIGQGLHGQIEAFLAQHPETGLVIIDTFQKVRDTDLSAGVYAGDYRDMSELKALADRHNIALLLVHHVRKLNSADPFQKICGSNALMGAADTIWLLERQRMSNTARMLVTGRDMGSRSLSLQSEECVWRLIDEEDAEQTARRAVPACVWAVAEFVQRQRRWQGTATELLAAAGISDVQPNQLTRKLVEFYPSDLAPLGVRCESHRTAAARQLCLWYDGADGDDDTIAVYDAAGDTAKTSSSSSSSSQTALLGNKHGLCVATGQPFAAADAASTGSAPNPAPSEVTQ